jgi:hypothetical protein
MMRLQALRDGLNRTYKASVIVANDDPHFVNFDVTNHQDDPHTVILTNDNLHSTQHGTLNGQNEASTASSSSSSSVALSNNVIVSNNQSHHSRHPQHNSHHNQFDSQQQQQRHSPQQHHQQEQPTVSYTIMTHTTNPTSPNNSRNDDMRIGFGQNGVQNEGPTSNIPSHRHTASPISTIRLPLSPGPKVIKRQGHFGNVDRGENGVGPNADNNDGGRDGAPYGSALAGQEQSPDGQQGSEWTGGSPRQREHTTSPNNNNNTNNNHNNKNHILNQLSPHHNQFHNNHNQPHNNPHNNNPNEYYVQTPSNHNTLTTPSLSTNTPKTNHHNHPSQYGQGPGPIDSTTPVSHRMSRSLLNPIIQSRGQYQTPYEDNQD